ncbi:MAG: beta-agarase, partial [Bacteroidota bacterium]
MKLSLKIVAFSLIFFGMAACYFTAPNKIKSDNLWEGKDQIMLWDFEEEQSEVSLRTFDATTTAIVSDQGVTSGEKALKLSFKGDEVAPGIELKAETPIDASQFDDFSLVFDATNVTDDHSVQIYVVVKNGEGHQIRRSAVVPKGATKTYFFQLAGEYVEKDNGLRDDPNPWENEASVQLKIDGLKYPIDFSTIASVRIYVSHILTDRSIIIDNVRLVENPAVPDDYLVGIIDKYGQAAKKDFEGKITSDEQLKALADAELKQLAKEGTIAGRSKFGGWLDGPKLEGTGFFRAEKVDGKWALVDPEGYLFFSSGIANVRMANTTTFTGVDFKAESVRYRDPEDVTPEDSRGMVKLSEEVTNTAYVAYPERNKMFLGLPTYDDPLANNYSYRREQYIGPFEHGETYSHYQANLERRYGEPTEDAHREKWVDVTLDRFLNWGFTSFGNWAAYEFYHENRMPYFANGWVIGDFKTVGTGYWGAMPDVFDPEFKRRAEVTVKVVAEEVKGNPWCIGVFIDNEKSWGRPGSVATEHMIV